MRAFREPEVPVYVCVHESRKRRKAAFAAHLTLVPGKGTKKA